MPFPKAVLFDLDGTLLDTERVYQSAWKKAAIEIGHPLSEERVLSLRSLDRRIADIRFQEWFGDVEIGKKMRALREEYMKDMVVLAKPGARELGLFLQSKGIPFCVCSASPYPSIKDKLDKGGIGDVFTNLFSARDVPHGKPEPDVYLAACKSLGIDPKEAIAVEDAPNGFQSALSAGLSVIYSVDLTEPDEFISSHAYKVVHSLSEIHSLLE